MGLQAVALAVSAIGTASSIHQGQQAASQQRRAQRAASASRAQQSAEQVRRQARQERIRRARLLNQAEQAGVSGSSGVLGASGSLSTQRASAQGFNRTQTNLSTDINQAMQSAAGSAQQAQAAGAAANVGMQLYQNAPYLETLFTENSTDGQSQ